jgi:hypothetical protein
LKTIADFYQEQIKRDQDIKQEAREQSAYNIIAMAYNHEWTKEGLVMVLQALGLDDGWIGEKIANYGSSN